MAEEKIFYLTKEGLTRIQKEYQELVAFRIAQAHPKDLKPEYAAFGEDANFLEVRLAELESILKNVSLIQVPPKNKQNIVNLGATVLVGVDDQDDEFTLVGHLEANPSLGRISNESPVGKALLGRKPGDRVVISSPVKTIYKIKKISYGGTS